MTDTIRLRMPGSDAIVTVSKEKAERLNWPRADEATRKARSSRATPSPDDPPAPDEAAPGADAAASDANKGSAETAGIEATTPSPDDPPAPDEANAPTPPPQRKAAARPRRPRTAK